MALIGAEFKKVLARKSVWTALLLLILLEIGFVWQLDRFYGNFPGRDRSCVPHIGSSIARSAKAR